MYERREQSSGRDCAVSVQEWSGGSGGREVEEGSWRKGLERRQESSSYLPRPLAFFFSTSTVPYSYCPFYSLQKVACWDRGKFTMNWDHATRNS